MKNVKSFFLFTTLILITGCSKLLFVKPMPSNGEIIRELPNFLNGTYSTSNELVYLQIERINDRHCVVYSYFKFPENHKLFSDKSLVEMSGDTMKLHVGSDSVLKLFFIDGFFCSEKDIKYEINLEENFVVEYETKIESILGFSGFGESYQGVKFKVILKKYDNQYFFNVVVDENWDLTKIKETINGFSILRASIRDSTFSEKNTYYNGITSIQKKGTQMYPTYLVNPTDKELFNFLEESKLFSEDRWIKLDSQSYLEEKNNTPLIIIISGAILIILASILFIIMKERKRRKANNG